jgi:hypothetical protein
LNILPSCRVGTTVALTVTYANGAAGVGATLTNAGAQAALTIDGVALSVNDVVLVKNQASTFQNGIYTVTNIGSGSSNWVMTRATYYDSAAEITPGDFTLITSGTLNAQSQWVETATVVTVGTDAITWDQFGADITGVIVAIQNNTYTYAVDTGAANAYVATLSPALTAYVAGQGIYLKVTNANTTASTINVNGLGAKDIKLTSGAAIPANAMLAGMVARLLYDGTNYQLLNPANSLSSFTLIATQVFTANGTYTPTTGMKYCRVRAVGGGAGGGACNTNNASVGGGGGAGGYGEEQYTAATIGASQAVTIGALGAGGTAGANPGSNGGNTTFGALLTANGGTGGASAEAVVAVSVAGGAGGTATGGDLNIVGQTGGGGVGLSLANTFNQGGTGGSNPLGMGGPGANYANGAVGGAALPGRGYGAGGGGAANANATAGADGTAGVVIVEEYA